LSKLDTEIQNLYLSYTQVIVLNYAYLVG